MYNGNMDQPTAITPQDALKYFLKNQDTVDLNALLRDFAVSEPGNFLEFLSDLTGKTPTQVAATIVKQRPETFMRFATGGQVKFKAARGIVHDLTVVQMQKVPAIKKIREAWGVGLKEAKDVVDLLQEELCNRGHIRGSYTAYTPLPSLSPELQEIFNFVKGHF